MFESQMGAGASTRSGQFDRLDRIKNELEMFACPICIAQQHKEGTIHRVLHGSWQVSQKRIRWVSNFAGKHIPTCI
jgi:hypothetical protein